MNGISLLLLLSTVGATTSVETGANGQPVYTIRIESLLINELRAGQAVPIVVAPKDRRLRYFRIAIAPDANLRSSSTSRASDLNSRAGDLFDYEPTQLESGEIEYAVQISPERLESLAAGRAIEGEIAPNIEEVHRFFIFVGIGQLPSQQQAAQQQAIKLAANGDPLPPLRGAEIRAPSTSQPRTSTTSTTKSFQPVTQPATQRNLPATDPLAQFNTRSTDTRMNWRNQPDNSTISPPPFIGSPQTSTSTSSSFPRSSPLPTDERNQYVTQPNYNNYNQPNYQDPNIGYGQQNPTGYPTQNYSPNPQLQYPPQQPPVATIAARNDVPAAVNPATQPGNGWSTPAPVTQPAPAAAQPAAVAPATVITKETDKDRPWTPLILTTLALFASLGTNAYLGWLAWSFFWRFRDAVTESARTRAQISSSRQAA